MPTDLGCVCAASRQLARILTRLYDGHLRPAGLESPQFSLLTALESHQPLSQVQLGGALSLEKTTVSRNLKLLERDGWIESSMVEDKRKRMFRLTPAGRRKLALAKPKWQKAQDQLRSRMTAHQWDELRRVIQTAAEAASSI